MEAGQVTQARRALGIIESGGLIVAEGAGDIADAVESAGYGQSWLFEYIGVKDPTPQWRVATLLPPIGDKPTLVAGSHIVGYDPRAVDRQTGEAGGFRHFKFERMGKLTPVEGEFTPQE